MVRQISEYKTPLNMKARTLLAAFSLWLLSMGSVSGQAPVWFPGTPAIPDVGPLDLTVNYGIDKVGVVYIVVFNYNYGGSLTSTGVKNTAIAGPVGAIVATRVIPVAAGNINQLLSEIIDVVNANRFHSVFIVAEGLPGGLQATPTRINVTTLPCPKIQIFTFFGNLGECVNLGAQGMFSSTLLAPAIPTGVLKGTQWTIDWGDGSPIWTYTSATDEDFPPVQLHPFSSTINCAYVGTWTVKNPCNEFLAGSSVFVVHGRDDPVDGGDGLLQMAETVTGDVDITYVCEGIQHDIVLQDISTWNCQAPVVPPPLNPADYDNDSPRTLQFVYGETPAGAIMNTITGNVTIGGSNTANSGNGYVGPVLGPYAPPNPGTLTDVITIPATANAGERFYVYLKDWNKCNPFVDQSLNYVDRFFIIEVIDAPPIPTVTSPVSSCFGSVTPTLSATPTMAGNTINWYSDVTLNNLLYTGNTYTHLQTAVGTYTYYATQTSGVNGCEGPAVPVVLVINPIPGTPTISRNNPDFCFDGTSSIILTADPHTPPAVSAYQWFRNGNPVGGATSSTITLSTVAQSGNYTVRTYGIAPTLCPSPISAAVTVTIGNPAVVGAGGDQSVCSTTNTVNVTGTRSGAATSTTWSTSGTGTFAAPANLNTTYTFSVADKAAGTVTLTITSNEPAGPCTAVSDNLAVTISPAATVNAGLDQTICSTTASINVTGLRGGSATSSTWSTSGTGTFGNVANLNTTYTPSLADKAAGTVNLTLTTNDPPTVCGPVNDALTLYINPAAVVGAGADQTICSTSNVALTGTRSGGATSTTWSTSGTGSFANATALITTYTPSAADISAGTVTLTITSNEPAGPCDAASDAMIVTINPAATANAGPDQSICATATATLAGSVGGGAANGSWTGGGGSYAPNANTLNAVYTPSAGERTAGTVTLILTTNDPGGPCGTATDNVTITIGAPLTGATISGSGNGCDGASSWFALTVNGGAPPYIINYTLDGAARPAVPAYTNGTHIDLGALSVNTHTVHIVSIQDACLSFVPGGSLPANYVFTIYGLPNAGGTVNNTPALCNNGTTDIVLQSTIPSSDFTWTVANAPAVTWIDAPAGGTRVNGNGTSIAQVLEHSATFPTTVTYSITPNGPLPAACPGTLITRTVIVNPTAQVNDPANQVHCAGTAVPALAFGTTRSGGVTTYSWTNSNTAIGLGAGPTPGNLPAFTATNAGTAPISATITVTPTFTNGGVSCTGPAQTVYYHCQPDCTGQ